MLAAGMLAAVATRSFTVAADGPFVAWPDDPAHRLLASNLVRELRDRLLDEPSATLTLGRWCVAHGLAADGRMVAERIPGTQPVPVPSDMELLRLGAGEGLRYRHVRLSCNGHPLSEADNWYVPDRLTPAMNRVLDTTDASFGAVVRPLGFTRTTLSSQLSWSPEIGGNRMGNGAAVGPLPIPDVLIENRALLRRGDGLPFSLVAERYGRGLLGFRPPPP